MIQSVTQYLQGDYMRLGMVIKLLQTFALQYIVTIDMIFLL